MLVQEGRQNPKQKTFIYVNNRLEGNALETIDAMLSHIVQYSFSRQLEPDRSSALLHETAIQFDSTNRWSLIRERIVDLEPVAIYDSGQTTGLNQRTGRRIIKAGLVDYEQVGIFRFGRKADFNKRTGGC